LERLDEPNAADGAQALRHDVEQCAAARTKNRPRVTAGLAYCGGSWTAPPAGAWTALPPLDLGQFGRRFMGRSSVRQPWSWMGEALLQTAGGGGVDAAEGRQGEVRRRRGKGGEAARRVRRRSEVEVEGRRGARGERIRLTQADAAKATASAKWGTAAHCSASSGGCIRFPVLQTASSRRPSSGFLSLCLIPTAFVSSSTPRPPPLLRGSSVSTRARLVHLLPSSVPPRGAPPPRSLHPEGPIRRPERGGVNGSQ
jgi:hypothetical protein